MKRAYVVPHPPIILPEVGRGEERKISKTIEAYKKVAQEIQKIKPETIIISSPHAPFYRDAFYMAGGNIIRGDLKNFGIFDVEEEVEIDQELSKEILKNSFDIPIKYTDSYSDKMDHGTLIPLRFIKEVYKDFKIVNIGLSTMSGKEHYKFGMAIERAVEKLGRSAVYVASGDLSHVLKEDGHYGFKEEGVIFDKKITDILEKGSFDELMKITDEEADNASQCGLRSFQIMAGCLNHFKVKSKKLSYEGPFGVGYGVFSYDPICDVKKETDPYIELAKKSMYSYIKDKKTIDVPKDLPEEMIKNRAGCFVTLYKNKNLRGCIGTIAPTQKNIAEEIIHNAILSSTEDPRFNKVSEDELEDLDISVDVLGEKEKISILDELDPKIYGVIVSSGYRRGLLLPKIEGVDTCKYQVEIALRKAGISPSEDFEMERFKVIRHEYEK